MKKLILIFIMTSLIVMGCESSSSPDTPEEVWGDLIEQEGDYIWGTLSEEQQELINYPKLDKDQVYWVPDGKSYHSIEWCYTLSNSDTILSGTLEDAIEKGKSDSCSKCVGD